mmetsp:Transcript_21406/g.38005  ORF Transcript_21406/g.38005 Transcript_21406/m.38005 type:complete len:511 (+) Transcript_21406:385-1917(+)
MPVDSRILAWGNKKLKKEFRKPKQHAYLSSNTFIISPINKIKFCKKHQYYNETNEKKYNFFSINFFSKTNIDGISQNRIINLKYILINLGIIEFLLTGLKPFTRALEISNHMMIYKYLKDRKDGLNINIFKDWFEFIGDTLLVKALKNLNMSKPLPLQSLILPFILKGRDLICLAKTGSGKTLSYFLPLLNLGKFGIKNNNKIHASSVIIAPTRELVVQISRDYHPLARILGMKILCMFGGSVSSSRFYKKIQNFQILISTPRKYLNLLIVSTWKIVFNHVRLIIDEADKLFELGFETLISKLILNLRSDKQICMFTSVFPYKLEKMVNRFFTVSTKIRVGSNNFINNSISQFFEFLRIDYKITRLVEILSFWFDLGKIIIFTNTSVSCMKVFKKLKYLGYPMLFFHSQMNQVDRMVGLYSFRNAMVKILVSTSLTSRGLDFKNLNLIINYNHPTSIEDYINRIGRTGRLGNRGTSITFVTLEDIEIFNKILDIITESNTGLNNLTFLFK